jgi:excisionase family DNA binding protein
MSGKDNTPCSLALTPREAAKALAISPRTLWTRTANGEIPHVKIGRSVRYRPDALAAWLLAHEKGGVAE